MNYSNYVDRLIVRSVDVSETTANVIDAVKNFVSNSHPEEYYDITKESLFLEIEEAKTNIIDTMSDIDRALEHINLMKGIDTDKTYTDSYTESFTGTELSEISTITL